MEKLLTSKQVADLLGINILVLYQWTYRNAIPHIKLSKRMIRFKESELNAWLEVKQRAMQAHDKNFTRAIKKKKSQDRVGNFKSDHISKIVENAKKEVLG